MKIDGHPYEFDVVCSGKTRRETAENHIPMAHGEQYAIRLRSGVRAAAEIKIDGVSIGKFVVPAGRDVTIERPTDQAKLLTFFASGTAEAADSLESSVSAADRGLIEIHFAPETPRAVARDVVKSLRASGASLQNVTRGACSSSAISDFAEQSLSCSAVVKSADFGAGITGLTGESSQRFSTTDMETDEKQAVTLRARFVYDAARRPGSGAMPLTGHLPKEMPVPPMVDSGRSFNG